MVIDKEKEKVSPTQGNINLLRKKMMDIKL